MNENLLKELVKEVCGLHYLMGELQGVYELWSDDNQTNFEIIQSIISQYQEKWDKGEYE